jgi:glutaredoxin 3
MYRYKDAAEAAPGDQERAAGIRRDRSSAAASGRELAPGPVVDDQQHQNAERLVRHLVEEAAVVVFSRSDCCMSLVVKRLFVTLGVSALVYELDQELDGANIEKALMLIMGLGQQRINNVNSAAGNKQISTGGSSSTHHHALPTVFVGGQCLGGVENVMAAHLSGDLVARLKNAGALWL